MTKMTIRDSVEGAKLLMQALESSYAPHSVYLTAKKDGHVVSTKVLKSEIFSGPRWEKKPVDLDAPHHVKRTDFRLGQCIYDIWDTGDSFFLLSRNKEGEDVILRFWVESVDEESPVYTSTLRKVQVG